MRTFGDVVNKITDEAFKGSYSLDLDYEDGFYLVGVENDDTEEQVCLIKFKVHPSITDSQESYELLKTHDVENYDYEVFKEGNNNGTRLIKPSASKLYAEVKKALW